MINPEEIKEHLLIRRLRCKEQKCRKIHHELPDILVPYKRHCAETIEKIITGQEDSVYTGEETISKIKKWWAVMLPYFTMVLLSLNAKFGTLFDPGATLKEIVRAVANSHLWSHTRSVRTALIKGATIIPSPNPSRFQGMSAANLPR
jgi:hypothetical protein